MRCILRFALCVPGRISGRFAGCHVRQIHFCRMGNGVLPDRRIRTPVTFDIMDAEPVAVIQAVPCMLQILGMYHCAELSRSVSRKQRPDPDLLPPCQHIYADRIPAHKYLFDIDCDTALAPPDFQFGKADIFSLYPAFVGIDI